MMELLSQFHFLRPWWLLAIIPIAFIFYVSRHLTQQQSSWQTIIQPHLLAFFSQTQTQKQAKQWQWLSYLMATLVAIIALAGPTVQQVAVPTFERAISRVILFDLSQSMNAADVSPNRITRATFKLRDLLNSIESGQVGLVAYGGDAFVLSPLTSDTNNIEAMIASLSTDLIPVQGSRPDLALAKAIELFDNSQVSRGEVILISDGFSMQQVEPMQKLLASTSHRLKALFVGTTDGAPIPATSGFVKDKQGAVVISKLEIAPLQEVFNASNASYVMLTNDDSDIVELTSSSLMAANRQLDEEVQEQWQDLGPYLVLLLLPAGILLFRRGLPVFLLLIIGYAPSSHAFGWNDLWKRSDQRGQEAFEQGQLEEASQLFKDPAWQASALYKSGEFEKAAEKFAHLNTEQGFYNQGNALAKTQSFEEAIKAYEKALAINPDHQDALHNKALLEDLLKQQSSQKNSDSQSQDSENTGENNENQQQSQNQQNQESSSSEQNSDSQSQSSDASQQEQRDESQSSQQQESSENSEASESQQQASNTNSEAQQNDSKSLSQQEAEELAQEAERQEQMAQQNPSSGTANEESEVQDTEHKKNETMLSQNAEKTSDDNTTDESQPSAPSVSATATIADENLTEQERKMQQWLQQIPDDPGGLLKRKMQIEAQRRARQTQEEIQW
ncbi:MAG: VWA domain-containing protein [Pseudomonadota bacterium]